MARTKENRTEEELEEAKCKAAIVELMKKLPKIAERKDKTNAALQAVQQCSSKGNMYSAKNKPKTSAAMNNALKACEADVDGLRKMLAEIQRLQKEQQRLKMKGSLRRQDLMQALNQQAITLPLYVCGLEGYPPGGVGGIPYPDGYNIEVGEYCAAHVDENWILGEIAGQSQTGKYDVKDIEDANKPPMIVMRRKVIALPNHRADPTRDPHALFPVDAIVLALYPQTTCFYKGCVISSPQTPTEEYSIAFEDSSYPDGFSPPLPVSQRYVLQYKEIKPSHKKKVREEPDA